MIDDARLAAAVSKMRKLRLIDHVAVKDSPPPAVTFLAVMQKGLGGCYEDAALEYIFRRFLKYYEAPTTAAPSSEHTERSNLNSNPFKHGCDPALADQHCCAHCGGTGDEPGVRIEQGDVAECSVCLGSCVDDGTTHQQHPMDEGLRRTQKIMIENTPAVSNGQRTEGER